MPAKRRMLLVTGSNVMVNSDLDALTHLIHDEWETVPLHPGLLNQVGDFDAVMLSHATGQSDRTLTQIIDATRPGRLFVHGCDVQFGRAGMLARPFKRRPVTMVGSLSPSIADTAMGDELRAAWMAPLHPDSHIVWCEYLAGLIHTKGPEIQAAAERARTRPASDVRAFYWGIKRPGVVESLRSLGFGSDKRDAAFGTITQLFRQVRNVTAGDKYDMDSWAHYAMHAEQVMLPYEPIKSEHQITRRLLECAILAGDHTVVDPRLSDHVQRFLDPAEWVTYAKQVSGELLEILDEGLPTMEPDRSQYGTQVGTKHGELLAWVLDNVDLPDGWAVEFGTGDGTSTRAIGKRMPVMTFDHFGGLPEKWRDGFDKGMFAQRQIPNVPGSVIVNGLFDQTLPSIPLPSKVALLHIDCDLYSSTKTVFERARDLIHVGTIVVFDELIDYPGWRDHEHRAWTELLAAWPRLRVEPIAHAHEAVAYRVTGV
jgi:predicted O-methyltransferase YrrM